MQRHAAKLSGMGPFAPLRTSMFVHRVEELKLRKASRFQCAGASGILRPRMRLDGSLISASLLYRRLTDDGMWSHRMRLRTLHN